MSKNLNHFNFCCALTRFQGGDKGVEERYKSLQERNKKGTWEVKKRHKRGIRGKQEGYNGFEGNKK